MNLKMMKLKKLEFRQMSIKTINKWKKIIETAKTNDLGNIIHEKAIFFSPVVYTPQKGKPNVIKYLSSAVKVFKGKKFKYINNEYFTSSAFFAEFSAEINNIEINGVDIIHCEYGLIKEFKVFLRPIKALEAVWSEMKKKLEEYDNNLS